MKKITISTLLVFFGIISFCQQTNTEGKKSAVKKIYLQAGTGPTSSNGALIDFGVQAILKSNWTISISYQVIEMNPKNLPDDYERGVTYIIFPFYDEMPSNDMCAFSFTAGKYFQTGRKTWFTMEAGLSLAAGQKFNFTPQPVIHDIFYTSSNYNDQKENLTTVGAVLKADFNWAFLPFMGVGAGVFANFNSIQSPLGFEVKFLLGRMNTKQKH